MILQEKFKQWLDTDPRVQIRDVQLEVIAEDFAIEFAEWVCKCEYNIQWFKDQNKTNELLEMYKETL